MQNECHYISASFAFVLWRTPLTCFNVKFIDVSPNIAMKSKRQRYSHYSFMRDDFNRISFVDSPRCCSLAPKSECNVNRVIQILFKPAKNKHVIVVHVFPDRFSFPLAMRCRMHMSTARESLLCRYSNTFCMHTAYRTLER